MNQILVFGERCFCKRKKLFSDCTEVSAFSLSMNRTVLWVFFMDRAPWWKYWGIICSYLAQFPPCEQSLLLSFSLTPKSSKQKEGSASRVHSFILTSRFPQSQNVIECDRRNLISCWKSFVSLLHIDVSLQWTCCCSGGASTEKMRFFSIQSLMQEKFWKVSINSLVYVFSSSLKAQKALFSGKSFSIF